MKSNSLILIIIVAAVVGAGGFFGGMKYQESQTPANSGRQFAAGNTTGRTGRGTGGNGTGFRPVVGSILSVDNGSVTVKLQDGSSKIVLLPDSVTVSKTDTGTISDLKVGETVGVFGTTNSDGSVTAQNVQLNPMFRNATGSGATR